MKVLHGLFFTCPCFAALNSPTERSDSVLLFYQVLSSIVLGHSPGESKFNGEKILAELKNEIYLT